MGMNRSGRSLPAGPAMTPQASSGWSARACAMIFSCSSGAIVSMDASVTRAPSPQRAHQGVLDVAEPVIDLEVGRTRVRPAGSLHLILVVLGDAQHRPDGEPDVVQRAQPRLRVLGPQPHAAAPGGQRVEYRLGRGDLARPQALLGVPAELPR